MIALTAFLVPGLMLFSWEERLPEGRTASGYFALLLATEATLMGVFTATDVFLFYVFFEVMLIPMYFLIGRFGGPRRQYAAVKFFLYSLFGGLIMLASLIGLYVVSAQYLPAGGTFDWAALRTIVPLIPESTQIWLFLGFFVAFAIKAPLVPLHTWLPDAGAEAPIGAGVLLVGVLDKVGTFGFLRYCLPLFPLASVRLAPLVLVLSVVGILYGALLAVGQKDMSRFVAYTSIAHFGFIALGIFAFSTQAFAGSVLYMVNHGLSTGMLFVMVGLLASRGGSRMISDYGGVAKLAPVLAGCFLLAGLSSLALPGTNSFVSEFLVLVGSFPREPVFTILATVGIVFAALYVLWVYQQTMQGPVRGKAVLDALEPSGPARRPRCDDRPGDRGPPCGVGLPGPVRPRDHGAGAADRRDPRARFLPRPGARRGEPVGRGHDDRGRPHRPGGRSCPVMIHASYLAQVEQVTAPPIDWGAMAPLLVVLGAACVAVLVEAFLPRHQRWPVQVGLSVAALGLAGLTLGLYAGSEPAGITTIGDALAVDRPTLFLWGTLLALGLGSVLLIADRSVEPGGAFVASAASRAAAGGSVRRHVRPDGPGPLLRLAGPGADDADRGLPVHAVRARRDDDVRRGERPADDVHRARGAQPAAVPDVRARAAAPAAVAGGGGQVLPARRVRLGVLPLRARADLRVRGLGAVHRHRDRRRPARRGRTRCCSAASRCSSSACCSRGRSARSTPGPRTSTRARRPRSRRSWVPARRSPRSARSCACCTWRSAPPAGSGGACCGPSPSSRW